MKEKCGCTDCACEKESKPLTQKEEINVLREYRKELEEELKSVEGRIKKLSAK